MLNETRMSLDDVLMCGSKNATSPPWPTTSSFFWVVCACAGRASAPGTAPAVPRAAAPFSRSRRVNSMLGFLPVADLDFAGRMRAPVPGRGPARGGVIYRACHAAWQGRAPSSARRTGGGLQPFPRALARYLSARAVSLGRPGDLEERNRTATAQAVLGQPAVPARQVLLLDQHGRQ